MRILLINILSFSLLLGITSCHDEQNIEGKLIGTWVYIESDDEFYKFKKTEKFNNDKFGIKFIAKGKLIKHQNVGWCGTPPIKYGKFKGKWVFASNSLIKIESDYWGGKVKEDWKIIALKDRFLKVKISHYPNEELK